MSNVNNWENAPKAPTAAGVTVWNKAQRDDYRKTQAFKNRNTLWNRAIIPGTKNFRFNAYSRVGKCAEIVAMSQAKSYNEFANYYLKTVHSWETVQAQADEWFRYCIDNGETITPEEALGQHLIHVLDQTWEGWEREERAAENLAKLTGKNIGRPDYKWDVGFAIDLVEVDEFADDGFTVGYQIKPTNFFLSPRQGVVDARIKNCEKHAAAEKKGKEIYFIDADALARGEVEFIHWKDLIKKDQKTA